MPSTIHYESAEVNELPSLTSFNARAMRLGDVVNTFVEPPAFQQISRAVNTVISGPRGSGKTTLLKMLQPEALDSWKQRGDVDVRFNGVFIATDRSWKKQLEPVLADTVKYGPEIELIGLGAFAMHTVRATLRTMRYVNERDRLLDEKGEQKTSLALARLLRLSEVEPSLLGLDEAATLRIASLQGVRAMLRMGRYADLPQWLKDDGIALSVSAIEIFNQRAGIDTQWALMFDEMELAPRRIVEELIDGVRGLPSSVLVKMSLSPVQPELVRLTLPSAPVHGQDIELVRLSNPGHREVVSIATKLLKHRLDQLGLSIDARALLGPSLFSSSEDEDREPDGPLDPYRANGPIWKVYKRLADRDDSFLGWLIANGVDLNRLDRLNPVERASKLRKIRNLVVVREYFRADETRVRSRQHAGLYVGADSVLAICDGNPRLITALLNRLLTPDALARTPVSLRTQTAAIQSVVERYHALIESVEAEIRDDGTALTLGALVKQVGEGLARKVVRDSFSANAPLSFTVDHNVSKQQVRLLSAGVNIGVFVHIPEAGSAYLSEELLGERFRLSYVLAPHFGLPLRLGPPTSLTSLIGKRRRPRGRRGGAQRRSDQALLARPEPLFDEEFDRQVHE